MTTLRCEYEDSRPPARVQIGRADHRTDTGRGVSRIRPYENLPRGLAWHTFCIGLGHEGMNWRST